MRILILGGSGMLGHRLFLHLRERHEVKVTLCQSESVYMEFTLFNRENSFYNVDARDVDRLLELMITFKPDAVVNCIGIVKQRSDANESIPCLEINSILPHRLALLCSAVNTRLIHLSTDCVFSGKKGRYKEDDSPDPVDLYGWSKLLGEIKKNGCITLRTSMIGPELYRKNGLLEWFLAQNARIKGYKKALFSGFTTIELSRIIEKIVTDYPNAHGVYHVSAEPITKYDLLEMIRERLGLSVIIVEDVEVAIDRSLDSSRFREEFNYQPPTWEEMLDELCDILDDRNNFYWLSATSALWREAKFRGF